MRRLLLPAVPAILLSAPALAEAPSVAADIAPVQGLVARVMDGVGEPALIIQQGASPHEYSLRPSEAAALENADIVFWIGESLTPWMAETVETLAGDATVVELLDVPGTVTLPYREGATFEAHDHGEDEHGHDDHGHDDHGHDEHAHDDQGHDHEGDDPHAWLDPENAKLWLDAIAAELSAADPANAATYVANAAAGRAEIDAASAEAATTVAPLKDAGFVVFHDAYQYFEARFGIAAAGAISLSDASEPSPARIAEIQAAVADLGVACVFSEPQFNAGLVATVMDGSAAKTAVLDPLGTTIEPGPGFYPALIRQLSASMAGCL
jgi:zinc transport system substrate-binding protein